MTAPLIQVRGLLAALFVTLSTVAAFAQQDDPIDYDIWAQTVERVDRVLELDRANEQTLQRIRGQLVEFRERFLQAQSANEDRITRLRSQLDALGPAPDPESGVTEPPEVADQRATLQRQIEDLAAPNLRARAAFAEANGLVAEVDSKLRARQTDRILTRWPIPLNPLNWQQPIADLTDVALSVPAEVISRIDTTEELNQILRNLGRAALSLVAGALIVFRTRHWSDQLAQRINAIQRRRLRRLLRLLIALAELGLPLLGLGLLLGAIQLTGLTGPVGSAVLVSLYTFGGGLIVGTWLVRMFFPVRAGEDTPLRITADYIPRARRLTYALVLCLSLETGLVVLGEQLDYSGISGAYLAFVLSIVMAYLLYRIARLFRQSAAKASLESGSDASFSDNVVAVLAWIGSAIAVLAPLAGLAGYLSLTNNVVVPAAQTYLLFGFLALAQKVTASFVQLLRSQDAPAEEEGLIPTLVGVVLVIAAIPVFALIWGARVTDLTEVWTRFREGFQIGDVTVSPGEVFAFLIVFVVGYTLTQLVQGALRHTVLPKTRLDQGARNAIVSGIGYLGIFLAAILAVTTAGIDLSNLAIFASALAVGIGFGLQTIVSNFVSGIILLVERPVSEGDWIEVGGNMGIVKKISVRATRIEKFDRTDLIIPNSDLISGVVTNWTATSNMGRIILTVSVAYGTDTRRVEAVLTEIANAHPMVSITSPPLILFTGFGADGLNFEVRCILQDVNFSLSVSSELNHEIARRFTEEGFEIPFAQRDIWLRNPESLRPVTSASDPAAFAAAEPRREDLQDADADGE